MDSNRSFLFFALQNGSLSLNYGWSVRDKMYSWNFKMNAALQLQSIL
jgi:hypothetical protein